MWQTRSKQVDSWVFLLQPCSTHRLNLFLQSFQSLKIFQLLCARVHAPSSDSVATRRHGSCSAIGYIKSRPRLWLAGGWVCGRGARLSFPLSLQTARGRNDAEIVWRCQVEMEGGYSKGVGAVVEGRAPKASISTWSLSDSLQLRCVTSPHKAAKAKSCYCCYPSIPAKSGTMLPGNSSAHKHCHTPADTPLKENSPSNTTHCTDNICMSLQTAFSLSGILISTLYRFVSQCPLQFAHCNYLLYKGKGSHDNPVAVHRESLGRGLKQQYGILSTQHVCLLFMTAIYYLNAVLYWFELSFKQSTLFVLFNSDTVYEP